MTTATVTPIRKKAAKQPAAWPADKVERRPVAELAAYAKNARTHSAIQVDQLAASIKEWGFTIPILVDDKNEIIAGHGRVLAAKQIGLDSVPVMVATGWTEKQIKAYRLADNQLALNSAWDVELLAAELGPMTDVAELIGLSEAQLKNIFLDREDGETDADAEWDGMPEFGQDNIDGIKAIVHFETKADQERFELLVGQKIPKNTKAIWYPAKAHENMRDDQWNS